MLRAVARRARHRQRALIGVGLDRSPAVIRYARARSREFPELAWVCADALALPFPPESLDAVISTTMLHHFSPEQAVCVLRNARSVARGPLIISDLVRSCVAMAAFAVFSRLALFCVNSREDGLTSLQRSYRPDELHELALAAGLPDPRVHLHLFSRMTLVSGPPEGQHGTEPARELR